MLRSTRLVPPPLCPVARLALALIGAALLLPGPGCEAGREGPSPAHAAGRSDLRDGAGAGGGEAGGMEPIPIPPRGGEPQYLQQIDLEIGDRTLRVDVARTDPERQHGLMWRRDLGADEGMLFAWPQAKLQSFWMANTPLPLSIAFVDSSGRIVQIEDMQPFDRSSIPSDGAVPFAIEVHQGWFRRNGVEVGDRVRGIERLFREPSLEPR